tara:strand:- start:927 stop:1067 length:141 start_codon:yes stop_codon:yes gene_type:complete
MKENKAIVKKIMAHPDYAKLVKLIEKDRKADLSRYKKVIAKIRGEI